MSTQNFWGRRSQPQKALRVIFRRTYLCSETSRNESFCGGSGGGFLEKSPLAGGAKPFLILPGAFSPYN